MNKKLAVLAISVVLLVSCQQNNQHPKIEQQFNNSGQKIELVVHTFDSEQKINKAYIEFWEARGRKFTDTEKNVKRAAWAGYSVDGKVCHLFVPELDRAVPDQFESWGHELSHCMYGAWHKEQ